MPQRALEPAVTSPVMINKYSVGKNELTTISFLIAGRTAENQGQEKASGQILNIQRKKTAAMDG